VEVRTSEGRSQQPIRVSFLQNVPVIDGRVTAQKESIPSHPFEFILDPAPGNAPGDANLRLAYGTSFLYVLVQCPGDRFTCRDRGYQNGDGLVVVLAGATPEATPSDEYAMLAFWPQDDPVRPFRTMLWGTNGRWPLTPLSKRVHHAVRVEDGVVSFEALIPWEEVSLRHPWLSREIGIDVLFAHALEDGKTEVYAIAFKDPSQSSPDHVQYRMCEFEPPRPGGELQLFVRGRRNIAQEDGLELQTVALSADPRAEELILRLYSGEAEYLQGRKLSIACEAGLTVEKHSVVFDGLSSGGYRVQWQCVGSPSEGEFGLTVVAPFDPEADARRLERHGTLDRLLAKTLRFHAEEVSRILQATRSYETCGRARSAMEDYARLLRTAEAGQSMFAGGETVRLAYQSALDGTLQPFTVILPANFDPERAYPLLVHLHGSDRDDTEVGGFLPLYKDIEAIVMAPFGRGTCNSYVKDKAQDDIREALEETCRILPVDRDRIVLAGFSMGGYGVYHTYATAPSTYRAFASFSGSPSAPWEPEAPDYTSSECRSVFSDAPIFVFHGRGDFNVPFAAAEKLIAELRGQGHKEVVVCLEDGGHGLPNEESTRCFHQWLKTVLEK